MHNRNLTWLGSNPKYLIKDGMKLKKLNFLKIILIVELQKRDINNVKKLEKI